MRICKFVFFFFLFPTLLLSQEELKEVYLETTLLDLPFSENFRSVQILDKETIEKSGVKQVTELLQQIAGVDIRQRGVYGTQADLYIRGGSFEHTLLLIDGIKLDDPQTGHHTLNFDIPVQAIERIEIIKGPAARVYGQNAYTGAINIITKKNLEDAINLETLFGSYGQVHVSANMAMQAKTSSHFLQVSKQTSDGYRYNTDFDNTSLLCKNNFNLAKLPMSFIGIYKDRKFGANGFYATPEATEQYEEVQSSLFAFSTDWRQKDWTFESKISWRRNQDLYLYDRNAPQNYRNLHITNKLAAQFEASYFSNLGRTKMGIDIAEVWITSNNLGNHSRFTSTFFVEQIFELFQNRIYITPGIAVSYFSDFNFHSFPGLDIGYRLNEKATIYGNLGHTYRIPTYTDLYYVDPTTFGNENLKSETASSQEIGTHFLFSDLKVSLAVFHRESKNLIDYVKMKEEALWEAINTRRVNTKGVDFSLTYPFKLSGLSQNFSFGYTYLEDKISDVSNPFSKYSINSLKHHITSILQIQALPYFYQNIVYKYAQRTFGSGYQVIDVQFNYSTHQWKFGIQCNNLLDTEYTESNLVPMPGRNFMLELAVKI